MHMIPMPGERLSESLRLSRAGCEGWASEDITLDPVHWKREALEPISPIHNRRIARRARRRARKRVAREG